MTRSEYETDSIGIAQLVDKGPKQTKVPLCLRYATLLIARAAKVLGTCCSLFSGMVLEHVAFLGSSRTTIKDYNFTHSPTVNNQLSSYLPSHFSIPLLASHFLLREIMWSPILISCFSKILQDKLIWEIVLVAMLILALEIISGRNRPDI